jgi:hypothetical protein
MNKLFTRPWIGVLIISLLLIFFDISVFYQIFKYGFLPSFILIFVFLTIILMFFVISPELFQEPIFSTRTGLYILGLFIFGMISFGLFGDRLGGIIFGLAILLSVVLFIRSKMTPNQGTYQPISEKPFTNKPKPPITPLKPPKQPYIVSDPTKPLQVNVANAIRRFNPSKKYEYEIEYQNELYYWLSREFPVEYEIQTGSSRPDLIIKNIAIEIKGPTRNRELDTLTTKFLKYSNHYPYFIIVLFDCNFSEGHFNEISNGIKQFAPHVKIIRK